MVELMREVDAWNVDGEAAISRAAFLAAAGASEVRELLSYASERAMAECGEEHRATAALVRMHASLRPALEAAVAEEAKAEAKAAEAEAEAVASSGEEPGESLLMSLARRVSGLLG